VFTTLEAENYIANSCFVPVDWNWLLSQNMASFCTHFLSHFWFYAAWYNMSDIWCWRLIQKTIKPVSVNLDQLICIS